MSATSLLKDTTQPNQATYSVQTLERFQVLTRSDYKTLCGLDHPPLDLTRGPKTWVDPDHMAAFAAGPASAEYMTPITYNVLNPTTKVIVPLIMPAGWAGSPNIPAKGWEMVSGVARYIADDGLSVDMHDAIPMPLRDLLPNEKIVLQMGIVPAVQRTDLAAPTTGGTATGYVGGLSADQDAKLAAIYDAIPILLGK